MQLAGQGWIQEFEMGGGGGGGGGAKSYTLNQKGVFIENFGRKGGGGGGGCAPPAPPPWIQVTPPLQVCEMRNILGF